jgi:chaperonin GroEL
VEKVKGMEQEVGFNALSGKYENMFAAGVVDPVKVTRSALQNAASIAALLLTTECLIADKPGDDAASKMPPMPNMM